MTNTLKTIKISERCAKRIGKGHLWIFSNEVETIDKTIEAGSVCRVVNAEDRFVDYAFFNPHSLITARLLKYKEPNFNEDDYVSQKLKAALKYRLSIGINKYGRVFFGESDGIPGLVVDKYTNPEDKSYLVVEMFSAGADRMTETIIKDLVEVFKPEGILLKNTNAFRTLEGLTLHT
jgi:23S rRNA (cytosine1962-C5)-methyltransferase